MSEDIKNRRRFSVAILDFDDIRNPLLNAGQARSTFEVGKRLAARGHRINVISSRYPGAEDRVEAGIEYRHIGLGSRWVRLNNLVYIPAVWPQVRRLDCDLILECFTAPTSVLFSPLITSIPVVAKPTSFEAERFRRRYHLPFDWVEKFGCRYYRYFIPANQAHADKMKKYNPAVQIKLITEGVGDEYFQIKRESHRYLLYLGRIDIGQKGLDLLLKAYALIKDVVGMPLVIAGHGPDMAKLKILAQRMGLSESVIFPGAAYGKKKHEIMSQSAIVIVPSRHEGFCLFALEALAAGLPIVSFDISGLSWLPDQAVRKAKPFQASSLAEAIKSLILDPSALLEAGRQASLSAGAYSWDKVADEYESWFNQIIFQKAKNQ